MQLEIDQKAFIKGWNYLTINLSIYPTNIQKVSITAKQYILKGIQDKNSAELFFID